MQWVHTSYFAKSTCNRGTNLALDVPRLGDGGDVAGRHQDAPQ